MFSGDHERLTLQQGETCCLRRCCVAMVAAEAERDAWAKQRRLRRPMQDRATEQDLHRERFGWCSYRKWSSVAFRIAHTCSAVDGSGMCTCSRTTAALRAAIMAAAEVAVEVVVVDG